MIQKRKKLIAKIINEVKWIKNADDNFPKILKLNGKTFKYSYDSWEADDKTEIVLSKNNMIYISPRDWNGKKVFITGPNYKRIFQELKEIDYFKNSWDLIAKKCGK